MRVSDTGKGIAKEEISTLFTRFGQILRTAENNHDGLGLGLMIVKHIIDVNGGTIHVESDGIGHGSSFVFTMRM